MPDISHLVKPDLGNYETVNKSENYDRLTYLESTTREFIHRYQEYQESAKSKIESFCDSLRAYESPIKDMDIFTRAAHEIVIEPPSTVQRRMVIDKLSEQNELLSKQHIQDKEQLELQKQEIDLLKKTLESLGILPSMDNSLNKIATQTEKEQKTPDYTKDLIAKGYLLPDGITTLKGLPSIVECLYTIGVENVTPEMLEGFKPRNGEPYSLGTRIQAVKTGKPDAEKKKRKKKQ